MNLFDAAHDALMLPDPAAKVAAVRRLQEAFLRGDAICTETTAAVAIPVPGRPDRPELVAPRELAARGLGSADGRAALIHAVAHTEVNAINLALDTVYRFRDLPQDDYLHWLPVALD